ncbi:MAG: hypothetical protein K8T90_12045 [Planctomycetes bacterium]|nr:hypothetical protein [Planctomycetota bacterium]
MGSGAFLVEACRQLAERLVEAWDQHKQTPKLPPDEDALLHAKRLIAQRCLYGVDKNPFAVNLAKLSLWLVTLAKDHPFTFVDHALRHGDSLVGLTREQIVRFHWDVGIGKPMPLLEKTLKSETDTARARRTELQGLGDGSEDGKRTKLAEAEAALSDPRLAGDLVIAAFFSAEKAADREQKLVVFRAGLDRMRGGKEDRRILETAALALRRGPNPIPPFHWEIEFPEVFGREAPGFDAIVGNPPFLGGRKISESYGARYLACLLSLGEDANGGADLVAHFFRRSFALLRRTGSFGLIATNTIGQGDTRNMGLRWICTHGGTIYAATRRVKWPGVAAVVVSVVHVAKGSAPAPFVLDKHHVPIVTAYLFHMGGHEDPAQLRANASLSFQGSIILGMGFTFDDTDKNGETSPLSEMRRLVAKDPRNKERIFPYIGGEELNDNPTHAHHRYVINFGEMTESEAQRWPDLVAILEQRVRPDRLTKDAKKYPRMVHEWWKFWNPRVELSDKVQPLHRVLATGRVSQHGAFAFLPSRMVFSEQLIVFPVEEAAAFCTLSSRIHECWVRFFASTLEERLRYTPTDCFETFPLPAAWLTSAPLELAGRAYYEYRARLMVDRSEGLTDTYNRLHDPEERSPDIIRLRELHAAMDRAVLDAYGWADIRPKCEFLLDYEIGEEEWGKKKKPYRNRWPDDVRDEVLGRLLELNRVRAEEERLKGVAADAASLAPGTVRRLAKAKRVAEMPAEGLFGGGEDDGEER